MFNENDQVQRFVDSLHDDGVYNRALEEIGKEENEKREFGWMENYILPEKRKEMYLDYVNNFLSVWRFAEHYNISENHAVNIINEFCNK